MTIQQILIKHWGYNKFRPLQEDVINSILEGNDTLALMPTGGGKSICFQVPALLKEGVCIVISPLIALMKDQVDNLRKKGINAIAVYSGMHATEIDIAFDNCIYGDVKFLYLSPERLATDIAKARISKMNVNLIAVDEAHCISQWGYDFRPPYMLIADVKKLFPKVPLLALTATATTDVVGDIQNKLLFKQENVFRKSFERKNLTYVVLKDEDKMNRLLRIVNKVKGTGIIYVRSRRNTVEISKFLNKHNIKADYYHAGLDSKMRDARQNAWTKGEKHIIVSTNAFGMGIDKPDVRLVVHLDLPDSLEEYFQEAGRAGRDEKPSYAVLLYFYNDVKALERNLSSTYPEIKEIKNVYQSLGNYFQLAVGSGRDRSFEFNITNFSSEYNFSSLVVYNSLKFLEKEGYIIATDAVHTSARIHFAINKTELYKFQVANVKYDNFIKTILRSYTGVFTDFIKINETELAKRTGLSKDEVTDYLYKLSKLGMIVYLPPKDKPQIIFCRERIDTNDLYISKEVYAERKKAAGKRVKAVVDYATSSTKCRSQLLLSYFGETDSKRCGKCDICIERNKIELNELEFDTILKQIKPVLKENALTIEEVVALVKRVNEDKVIKAVQWLLDNGRIYYNSNKKLTWRK